MKKIGILIIGVCLLMITGCGGSGYSSYGGGSYENAMDSMGSYSYAQGVGVTNSASSMDYSNTNISGSFADYSYYFSANGEVKKKEEVLDEYEKIQTYVNEHGGYIENVRNTYNGYDIDWADSYFTDTEINYQALGGVNFTVEVDNDEVENVIQELVKFTDEKNLTVTRYDQYITNYEAYEIVDEEDWEYYYGNTITQEELEKRLKYASINVSLSYRIPRNGFMSFVLYIVSFAKQVRDVFLSLLATLLMLAVFAYIALYLIILPVYKLFKKSLFKFRVKHNEYYLPKEIIINNAPVEEVIMTRKQKKKTK